MRQHPTLRTLPLLLLTALVLGGCTTNPVTGESQLRLMMSEDEEIAIGKEQYQPTLQTQGGRYYRSEELNAYVSEVGQSLARVSDRPNMPYEFTVINSGTPNAWALPGARSPLTAGCS